MNPNAGSEEARMTASPRSVACLISEVRQAMWWLRLSAFLVRAYLRVLSLGIRLQAVNTRVYMQVRLICLPITK